MYAQNNEALLLEPETEEALPRLYSKRAIWGFSIFFSTIFGGVLLYQNLRDLDKKYEAKLVLLFASLYTVLGIFALNSLPNSSSSLTYIFNGIGGAFLSEYFFQKHMHQNFKPKKIWKALIISALVTIPFIIAMIYGNDLE
ncbi:hypothetical protein [Hymenobacter daecheongensis]|uniref:hypothetical protein n=1 Tax=Hymenobacter daecheongensis TaxID=496053 RepID=UPI0009334655|nr:hypothetical protein [Hymenobacter daecheongensis]